MDCVVAESSSAMKIGSAEVWPAGTAVERDIDGCWFQATIEEFHPDATFTIRFTDDDNTEEGVEVSELRKPLADGSFELLSEEVAAAAAKKLPAEAAIPPPGVPPPDGRRGSWQEVDDEPEMAAWEASETGSEGSRPQTDASSPSEGGDWVVVEGGVSATPPEGVAPNNSQRRRGRGNVTKAMLNNNSVATNDVTATGSGLRALRALRRSKECSAAQGA